MSSTFIRNPACASRSVRRWSGTTSFLKREVQQRAGFLFVSDPSESAARSSLTVRGTSIGDRREPTRVDRLLHGRNFLAGAGVAEQWEQQSHHSERNSNCGFKQSSQRSV